jgi:D-alanyl-D-alanine carboxypeptidase
VLAGEGVLSLDDSVERWLPAMSVDPATTRLRSLLDHTRGVHDPRDPHFFDPYLVRHDWAYVYTPDEVVRASLAGRRGHRDRPAEPGAARSPAHLVPDHRPTIPGRIGIGYDLTGQYMSVFNPSYDGTAAFWCPLWTT